MNILRRICAVLAVVPSLAAAQTYPDKPIRVIVPVPAGGTPDLVARMVAPGMSSLLGQQLVMDNRGGAGGLIGAELAAKAAPDGYTLLLSSPGPITILPHLQKQLPYDTLNDFVAIGLVSAGPYVLIAHPSVPVKTVKELIAVAKFGLLAPTKTPKAILTRLNDALVKVVRAPDTRSQFEALGADPIGSSSEEFAAFIRRELDKYAKLVKLLELKAD